MSAFICGSDHFIALAVFAASNQGSGYGQGHIAVDPRYVHGLSEDNKMLRGVELATAYANILYAENIRSCQARYSSDDIDNLPSQIHKPAEIKVTSKHLHHINWTLKPVQILSMCDCLEYQSCETRDYRESLAFDLLNAIRKAAWKSLPGYENAPWDYVAPEAVRA